MSMPHLSKATSSLLLLVALMLAGCGADAPTPKPVPTLSFKSAAFARGAIPATYTCDGPDISPPVEWGAVPAGTGDLALFILGLKPESTTGTYHVSVEWAVAGINPSLHMLAAGRLPRGAFVGVATDGKHRYSICPQKGAEERYVFELYGVPSNVAISPRFAGAPVLQALSAPGGATSALAHGSFLATYTRP
jgi:phosphatidylethanolamine-binding protein (PEBP) family uncharacterized protein